MLHILAANRTGKILALVVHRVVIVQFGTILELLAAQFALEPFGIRSVHQDLVPIAGDLAAVPLVATLVRAGVRRESVVPVHVILKVRSLDVLSALLANLKVVLDSVLDDHDAALVAVHFLAGVASLRWQRRRRLSIAIAGGGFGIGSTVHDLVQKPMQWILSP